MEDERHYPFCLLELLVNEVLFLQECFERGSEGEAAALPVLGGSRIESNAPALPVHLSPLK